MKISDLANLLSRKYSVTRLSPGSAPNAASLEVLGLHHDSRELAPSDAFFVRKGKKNDGFSFLDAALQKGVSAFFLEARDPRNDTLERLRVYQSFEENQPPIPVFEISPFAQAFAYASSLIYGEPSKHLSLIGITGTNGKTTTSHLIKRILDKLHQTSICGSIGTVGHFLGPTKFETKHTTPEADELARILAWMLTQKAKYCAMEVSSIAIELERVHATQFDIAAFTNLTQDHLDFHETMEAYANAKKRLFLEYRPRVSVINITDPFGSFLAEQIPKERLLKVSSENLKAADIYLESAEYHEQGMHLRIHSPEGLLSFPTKLLGKHNIENIVVTLGALYALGKNLKESVTHLEFESGAEGRLERCDTPDDDLRVLVDYAHTPDALGRVLQTLKENAQGKAIWCVFGCGGDRDRGKRPLMGKMAGRYADRIIVTNDNPRSELPQQIADEIVSGIRETNHRDFAVTLDRKQAISEAIKEASPKDIVLLAGKGHEQYQTIGEQTHFFDDREEARKALVLRRTLRGISEPK